MLRRIGGLALASALWLAGCATRAPLPPVPPVPAQPSVPAAPAPMPAAAAPGAEQRVDPREIERGIGSWYGDGFQGRRTASGEAFEASALTAAHRTLPFGTLVRVRNPANGQEVVVRINDRGPHVGGRIIDMSRAAASRIGLLRAGVAPVILLRE